MILLGTCNLPLGTYIRVLKVHFEYSKWCISCIIHSILLLSWHGHRPKKQLDVEVTCVSCHCSSRQGRHLHYSLFSEPWTWTPKPDFEFSHILFKHGVYGDGIFNTRWTCGWRTLVGVKLEVSTRLLLLEVRRWTGSWAGSIRLSSSLPIESDLS